MSTERVTAFGAPGLAPTQAPGDKDMVTRSLGTSRVAVTIGRGIVNEVYWPTLSRPQVRDLGFLVTGRGFWTEVQYEGDYTLDVPDPSAPLPMITHHHDRFDLRLQAVCSVDLDALVIEYELKPTIASPADDALTLHVLIAPHIGGTGNANRAWSDGFALHASRALQWHEATDDAAEHLVVLCDPPPANVSVGYVGFSDGWQDINAHGRATYAFTDAPNGNVALTATLQGWCGRVALGLATTAAGAVHVAGAAMTVPTAAAVEEFLAGWRTWSANLPDFGGDARTVTLARTSAMVIKVHEDVVHPGAIVASLATPWGFAHDDPGGYHLVWPRDCAESALALAAIGRTDEALATARFLAARQLPDGHWNQNFTTAGDAYWSGLQLDETALPVVLVLKLAELGVVEPSDAVLAPMVRAAVQYLGANGPFTDEDRWEESRGASPFTLAATIVALAGASLGGWLSAEAAAYALSLADWWNERIEDEVFVTGSPIDEIYGTSGHYERIAAPGPFGRRGDIVVANRQGQLDRVERLVGLEFLAIVRFGLRSPFDVGIVDTVRIVDGELRVDTPGGPLYRRYQNDGYGEHDDGAPFDGSGVGRLWPLLTGERGMYAAAAGEDPWPYLRAMCASTSLGDLLPEQVWDGPALPDRHLVPGKPSGSATPLVWAHSEFLKLLMKATNNTDADMIGLVRDRYVNGHLALVAHVRDELDVVVRSVDGGWPDICVESAMPFRLHAGIDGWQSVRDVDAISLGLSRFGVRLTSAELGDASSIEWTRFDPVSSSWEGRDHQIRIERPSVQ